MNDDAQYVATCIAAELKQPVPEVVQELGALLAQLHGEGVGAVLFYGSALGASTYEGILDFYVLIEDESSWPGSHLGAIAHRLLPPMVGYFEGSVRAEQVRAKYAVMRMGPFERRMQRTALDTTLWARFCQPATCVWTREPAALARVQAALQSAVVTAARWAAQIGPPQGAALDFWRALYARTYAAELRIESSNRGGDLVARRAPWFDSLLRPAWRCAGIPFTESAQGVLTPQLSARQRRDSARRWKRRARWGKPLNVLRLAKAAFTFEGAMDYAVWKIERHSGVRIDVRPWQRRFPLLAAPALYWQLHKRRVLR